MILETVIFTALPISRTANSLSLSCFISPQLGGREGNPQRLPLSQYVDFAGGAWASIVRQMTWTMTLRYSVDDSDEVLLQASRVSPDPDRALSAMLFPDSMPVDPFTYDNVANGHFLSFPLARLSDALDAVQVSVVRENPEDRPEKTALVTPYQKDGQRPPDRLPLDPFNLDPQRRASLNNTIDQQLQELGVTKALPVASANAVPASVEMLNRMLTVQATREQMNLPPLWPDLDFHQVLALLGSHPSLLRKLGYIVDLRVDLTGVPKRYGTPRVYVGSSWPGGYDPDARGVDITTAFPRVASRLSATVFRVRADAGALRDDGFVDVAGMSGVTSQVEIETLATQTEATGISRAQQGDLNSFGTPDRTGTPARHNAGIAIVQTDYASALRTQMLRQNSSESLLSNGDEIPLAAEDVLIGYRVDVRPVGTATWRTLHRRHGTLHPYVGRAVQSSVDLGDDEGWVEPAGTSDAESAAGTAQARAAASPLRITESVARWDGWSLSIPQPGKLLNEKSEAADPSGPDEAHALIDSMHATIDYDAPAAGAILPTLRFSKVDYEFRLRWVDLAGNSAAPDATGGPTLVVPYRRHDPVASPGLYLTADPVWGESVEVVVVRTGATPALSRTRSSRYVAPPNVSAALALTHGKFDDASGRPQATAYDTIAHKESASFPGQQLAADPVTVPYLADPLANGLFVRGVPTNGATYNAEKSLAYGGTWPELNVLQLIVDGSLPAGSTTQGRTMTVGMPAGRVAHLRMSNSLTQAGLELMDLWRRSAAFGNIGRARAGAWWSLTPDRVLVVVHASQQPILAPAFVINGPPPQRWRATRSAGESSSTIRGKIAVDMPSTESLTLTGLATVFVDDGPGTGTPYVAIARDVGVLGTVSVPDPAPGGGAQDFFTQVRAPFNDTKRIGLVVSAEATSRFAEYFRQSTTFVASDNPVVVNGGHSVVSGSVRVTYTSDPKATAKTATTRQYSFNIETATFQRLLAGLPVKDQIPVGATVTVSFIPNPITRVSQDFPQANRRAVGVTVPSSARPLAPEVVQVLPAFRWSGPSGTPLRSQRLGGGLRIYLKRPWGSSGLNEDLAVLLRPANAGAADAPIDTFVTRWGQDPTLLGNQPPNGHQRMEFPKDTHFLNRDETTPSVSLAEFNAVVDIARYRVGRYDNAGVVSGYDAARDEWFVDIDMNVGTSYRPFIQLALARYQETSVGSLGLSPVTLVDVVQLEPDRTVTVAVNNNSRLTTTLSTTLVGPTYASNELGTGPGKAIVILEHYVGSGSARDSANSAAWEQVSATAMTGQIDNSNIGTWTADIRMTRNRTAGEYRLVFEQYETLRNDGRSQLTSAMSAQQKADSTGLRLVHQDIVYVPVVPAPPKA